MHVWKEGKSIQTDSDKPWNDLVPALALDYVFVFLHKRQKLCCYAGTIYMLPHIPVRNVVKNTLKTLRHKVRG